MKTEGSSIVVFGDKPDSSDGQTLHTKPSLARVDCNWSSIPAESQKDRLKLLGMVNLRQHDADLFAEGAGIPIVHLIRCPYVFTDENEERQCIARYVAIDVEGNAYNLFGKAIVNDIDNMVSIVGKPPYDPPIVFKLREVDIGKPSKLKRMNFE